MSAIRVKLVRGLAGCPAAHRLVVRGLGLGKRDSERVLPDTPATLGMIAKVAYLVSWERVGVEPPPGRAARAREARKSGASKA